MLKSVLGVYLDKVKELDFYLPFVTILRAEGFFDIHLTHGQVEFGKDFIAKRIDVDAEIQYAFQLKSGNINQGTWKSDIQGQILEALLTGLVHPNYDTSISQKSVLVITGKLVGNSGLSMHSLNNKISTVYELNPITLWDKEILIDKFSSNVLEEFYSSTSSSFVGYGDFVGLFGRSLNGYISTTDIELHSRNWLTDTISLDDKLLGVTLESEILFINCINNGFIYEGIFSKLSALRVFLHEYNKINPQSDREEYKEIIQQSVNNIRISCHEFIIDFINDWNYQGKNLLNLIKGSELAFSYLANCARILEISGLTYFLVEEEHREEIITFIVDFITVEPGSAHIPSDNYAISIILVTLALIKSDNHDLAAKLLKESTIWLCDRYQEGNGIAPIGSSAYDEIKTLFGYPFEFFDQIVYNDSFFATIISDLAAFLGNKMLYSDIVNDIQASNIFPTYWQVPDGKDLFSIEGKSIISYPSTQYSDELTDFEDFNFSQHISQEPKEYKIIKSIPTITMITMMLFLRDRYYPSLWIQLS